MVAGVICLLALLAGELAFSTRQQSQTFDEAAHIFAGYRSWKNFDFGINPEHPPLVKLVAAIPLLFMPLKVPAVPQDYFKFVEYTGGREFLYANDAGAVLFRARLAAAIFTILLALTVFLVARSMWGDGPAFLALILLVFDPNMLAHGALVTTDMGVTFGPVSRGRLFLPVSEKAVRPAPAVRGPRDRRLPRHETFRRADFSNAASPRHHGATPVARSFHKKIAPDLWKRTLRQIYSLVAITGISLVVLWSFYGFRYSARAGGLAVNPPLADFAHRMGPFSFAIVMKLAHWHLLPESYLYGVVDVSRPPSSPHIFSEKYTRAGQWFYFPAIFIIKSTVAFLLLCCLVPLTRVLREKTFRRECFFLLIPPAVYFGAALFSGINYGVRHLLPVYPFLIVLVAFCAWNLAQRHRAVAAFVAAVLLFHIVSSVRAFPNYIPYANELWGGPQNAHHILADSNVDWGQGLKAMKQYIDERQIKNCWFAYFGSVVADAAYYGIPCKPLPTSFANAVELQMPCRSTVRGRPRFLSATEIARHLLGRRCGQSVSPLPAMRPPLP